MHFQSTRGLTGSDHLTTADGTAATLAREAASIIAERGEHFGGLDALFISKDHRLAPAHRQAGHGVLVTHPARQTKAITHGACGVVVVPETGATRRWAEMSGVHRNDRCQPARFIVDQLHKFMRVEIGLGPESGHQLVPVSGAGQRGRGRG
jgi:hypothetical protein